MHNRYIHTNRPSPRSLFLLAGALLTGSLAVRAQDTSSSQNGRLLLLPVRNVWIASGNAAGIATLPTGSIGVTSLEGSLEEGPFKRVQTPAAARKVHFSSERYQQLQEALIYGGFRFTQGWEQDIRFSDVMNPYRRNPYIMGDSLGGDWKKQQFELLLKASAPINAARSLYAGAGIEYEVGTGARQNDPRPLTYTNDIRLHPGLVWKAAPSLHLGINGQFSYFQENISIDVSNYEDIHYIYRLAGLGSYYREIISTGYTRYYNGRTHGGALQLQWEKRGWSALADAGIAQRIEEAKDGSTLPRPTGRLEEMQYHAKATITRMSNAFTHQWQLSWQSSNGEGTDYHTMQDTATRLFKVINSDPLNSTYYNEAGIHYRLIRDAFDNDFHWMAEASVQYNGMDNKLNHPQMRQIVDANEYRLSFTRNHILSDARNFLWQVNARYRDCFTAKHSFAPFGGQTQIVYNELFLPDMQWMSADAIGFGANATYRFPVRPSSAASLFVKAAAQWNKPLGSDAPGGTRRYAGISVGMTY